MTMTTTLHGYGSGILELRLRASGIVKAFRYTAYIVLFAICCTLFLRGSLYHLTDLLVATFSGIGIVTVYPRSLAAGSGCCPMHFFIIASPHIWYRAPSCLFVLSPIPRRLSNIIRIFQGPLADHQNILINLGE